MSTTMNVEWDPGLEAYKGRDTTTYVAVAAATATACAQCRQPLSAQGPLSLSVHVTEGPDRDGTEYFTFDPEICHRSCREPSLMVTAKHGEPVEFTPHAARFLLEDRAAATTTAVLVFTYKPTMSFREPGGEMASALVTGLISQGFQLSMSADIGEILSGSGPVADSFTCRMTREGLLTLHAGGAIAFQERLDPADLDEAAWLGVAGNGTVLVVGGDNLTINDTNIYLAPAALLGTLVAGLVSVDVLP